MDFASLIGIVSGLSLIISAIFLSGDIKSFINVPGMMIVLGGTMAATLLTFTFREVAAAFRAAAFAFTKDREDPNTAVETMIRICNVGRKKGLLELGNLDTDSGFLKKACGLIADGSEEDVVRAALRTEIDSLKMRHFAVQDVFKKMGAYAPAFGMLGTLIGLVHMLSKLADPSSIGPAMAVALLTTFYGSLLSSMVFLPMAGKLKARTISEVMQLEIMLEGAIAVLKGNNPIMVYESLSSFIPIKERVPLEKMDIRQGDI
ncbi:MotA/TolQ/ExbB proton channel family protein [Desulfobotulus sp. H1]|uniref:MotA/TolQ/ExbB proton channel family protein n=1 Tax=Desulfobotulus pelophilus TaxID=2823377 RepID=A0ABT3N7X9_9BACT|nr:MotA/TolQ/ExbB proton channel family protein [Desulfobotulus pelophilus]MCW7753567.1 MotA/TolQ/ExbB proton channel family protein [Desulfobotulus pelophilus]